MSYFRKVFHHFKDIYQKRYFPIRTKLMLIISAVVFISLGLLITISLGLFQEDMTNMVTYVNSNTTKLLSDKVESEIKSHIERMKLIHSLSASGGKENLIRSMFFHENSDFMLFTTYSVNATEINGPGRTISNQKQLQKLGLTQENTANKLRKASNFLRKAAQGELVVRNLNPWLGKQMLGIFAKGSGQNVFVALITSESLSGVFSVVKPKGGSSALYNSFLVDPDGLVVVHSDEKKMPGGTSLIRHPAIVKMREISTKSGVVRYDLPDSSTEFGAFQRLQTGKLTVITTVNETLALEGVKIARIRSFLISLLIISLAILFIYYFSKTISSPIRQLVNATHRIRGGHYDVHIDAKANDEIGELTTAFNHMNDGLKEREKLKGAFNKFVNEEVANMILKGDLALGGETKNATVFFSDIRGFTAISESMAPSEVVEFLNQYMTLMVDIIYKNNGVVDKFIGDAIMAVWGAPVSKGNDTEDCIVSALRMREALMRFNANRGNREKPLIKIGCGINTGPVLAGQIGSNDRLEYTVIGDTVNLASRIESLNKPFGTDILVSEATYNLIKRRFHCVAMHKIKVKGKAKPQQIFAVLGEIGDRKAPKNLSELHKLIGQYPNLELRKKGAEKKYEIT